MPPIIFLSHHRHSGGEDGVGRKRERNANGLPT